MPIVGIVSDLVIWQRERVLAAGLRQAAIRSVDVTDDARMVLR